jgi:hypothetical protein
LSTWSPLGDGAWLKEIGQWDYASEGYTWSPVPSLLLIPCLSWGVQTPLPHVPADVTFCLTIGPKLTEPKTIDWNLLNHEINYVFLLLSCLYQAFGQSDAKVTNIGL